MNRQMEMMLKKQMGYTETRNECFGCCHYGAEACDAAGAAGLLPVQPTGSCNQFSKRRTRRAVNPNTTPELPVAEPVIRAATKSEMGYSHD